MSSFERLRKQLGLSQRQLAAFIGMDHTQIHRLEKGTGLQGAAALPALMPLYEAAGLGKAPRRTAAKAARAIASAQLRKAWLAKAKACRSSHDILQRKIEVLQAREAKNRQLLQCLELLEKQPALSSRQKQWIKNRRLDAQFRLSRCTTDEVINMQLKQKLLLQEAAFYEKAARS